MIRIRSALRAHYRAALACAPLALVLSGPAPATAQEATTAPTCTGCSPGAVKRSAKPRAAVRAAPRETARPAVDNEGRWVGVSTGPCIVTWRWRVKISHGTLSGKNATGQVARSGASRGVMTVFGKTYRFSGRFGGATASGTWVGPACSGAWSASKA